MDFLFINGKHWQTSPAGKLISHLYKLTAWCRTINPVARSKRNVAHHYDLTDQLFDLFLDRQRQYSCAYFAKETDDLEMAQNPEDCPPGREAKPDKKSQDIGYWLWMGRAGHSLEHPVA